jgi:hypothetical protein
MACKAASQHLSRTHNYPANQLSEAAVSMPHKKGNPAELQATSSFGLVSLITLEPELVARTEASWQACAVPKPLAVDCPPAELVKDWRNESEPVAGCMIANQCTLFNETHDVRKI